VFHPEADPPGRPEPGGALLPDGAADVAVTAQRRPFDPLTWTTRLVLAALILTLALDVVAVVSDVSYHRLVDRFAGGADVSLQDADDRQSTIAQVQLALFAATAVVFIVWFHRAYRNLGTLGVDRLRWGTGWAVGAWVVPFLNLVRPKSIANDIWRGSDPDLPREIAEPAGDVPWFHNLWWAVFLADGVFGRISARYFADAESVSDLSSATAMLIASDVLDIFACLLAIGVVSATAVRQRRRAAVLGARATEPERTD
jgi:Domain of unknown function (DUF4328)